MRVILKRGDTPEETYNLLIDLMETMDNVEDDK